MEPSHPCSGNVTVIQPIEVDHVRSCPRAANRSSTITAHRLFLMWTFGGREALGGVSDALALTSIYSCSRNLTLRSHRTSVDASLLSYGGANHPTVQLSTHRLGRVLVGYRKHRVLSVRVTEYEINQ